MPDMEEEQLLLGDGGELSAYQIFTRLVLPLIQPTCRGCHGGRPGDLGPPFMASAHPDRYDPYPTMRNWRNFTPDIPEQSLLLTRGPHEGPALDLDQTAAVLRWLRQEKVERDLLIPPPTRPQTRPMVPRADGSLNIIQLSQIDRKLEGAFIQFTAQVSAAMRVINLRDLRIVNRLPGALPDDQRTIRIARPIAIVWNDGRARPDVGDSLGHIDRNIKLNEDDRPPPQGAGGPGILLTPLLTLPNYNAGDALSFAFNIVTVVGQVAAPDTCRPMGLQVFGTQVKEFLGKMNACSRAGCHDATARVGGLNFVPLRDHTGTNYDSLAELCEQVKYYRKNRVLEGNMNPMPPPGNTHRFRWGPYVYQGVSYNGCRDNGFPDGCFSTYVSRLEAWAAVDP